MQKDELIRRLMKTFIAELDEYVETLNRDLLDLERAAPERPRDDIFKSLFRMGHSLKGTSRSMSIDSLAAVGHHLEEVFTAMRDRKVALTPPLFELLFATADGIKDAGRRLSGGEDAAGGPLIALMPRLAAAATAPAARVYAARAAACSSPATGTADGCGLRRRSAADSETQSGGGCRDS